MVLVGKPVHREPEHWAAPGTGGQTAEAAPGTGGQTAEAAPGTGGQTAEVAQSIRFSIAWALDCDG